MGNDPASFEQSIDFLFTSVTQTETYVVPSETKIESMDTSSSESVLAEGKNAPFLIDFDDGQDELAYNVAYKCASILKKVSMTDPAAIVSPKEVEVMNYLICEIDALNNNPGGNTLNNGILTSQVNTLEGKHENIDGKITDKNRLTSIMFALLILQIILTLTLYFYNDTYASLALVLISTIVFVTIMGTVVYNMVKRIEGFTTPDESTPCQAVVTDSTDRNVAARTVLQRIDNLLRRVISNQKLVDDVRIHTNRSFVLMRQYQLKDYQLRRMTSQRIRIRYAYLLTSLIGVVFYLRNNSVIDTQLTSITVAGLVVTYLFIYAGQSKVNSNRAHYNWERINWGQYTG
jgi:VIT1/CCC1 family predicted Fe2+/Mn2+ transporter